MSLDFSDEELSIYFSKLDDANRYLNNLIRWKRYKQSLEGKKID